LALPTILEASEFRKCDEVKSGETCICENGFCLSRDEVDKINVLILDYPRQKAALKRCLERSPVVVEEGWSPWIVVVVGIVAVGVAASGGYLVAQIE